MNKFRLEIRRLLTIRRVRVWNKLPKGVVKEKYLLAFKTHPNKFVKRITE